MLLNTINPNNQVSFGSFYDKFFKSLPDKDLKNPVHYTKLGHALASPHINRTVLGVAAFATQPWMDLLNPKVDKDTAISSMLRTISKILVCSSIGFVVRGSSYYIVDKFAKASKEEGSTLLTPDAILKKNDVELRRRMLKIHKNSLSTVLALSVMVFTNFLADAPLTTKLSNFLIAHYKKRFQANNNEVLA